MLSSSKKNLLSQKRLLALSSVGAFILIGGLSYFLVFDDGYSPEVKTKDRMVDLPGDRVDAQEIWMSQVQSENRFFEQRLKYIEELLLSSSKREEEKNKESEELKREIHRLREELSFREKNKLDKEHKEGAVLAPFGSMTPPIETEFSSPKALLEVVMDESKRNKTKHVDKAIPAATTVKAILVSSVDALCGVGASSDPQPIKLRILGDGKLPNGVRAKLKGGLIVASAYGHLSSERVFIRIERLTQTKANGNFIETDVTGFVTGEDGKYGLRGIVVDRSDKLVKNAFISGLFGGVSQFLSTTQNAQDIRDATSGLPNSLRYDILKDGGLKGVGGAMDKLSDYYIKRAEQLQPVIQVAAGRIVDITFTCGAELGDLHTKDKVRKIREGNHEI